MDNKKYRYNEIINDLKTRYPIFNNINNRTSDLELKHIITQHRLYNDNNTKYHKLKEIDCNINTLYNPLNSPNEPIVLRGFCKDTPAFKKWNIHNLPHHFGDNKVNIEYYNSFVEYMTSEVATMKNYNMKQYLDNKDKEYLYFGETAIRQFKKTSLIKDIQNPRIKSTDYKNSTSVIFLGNKFSGSATHIHVTWFDYLLNQTIGSKTMYFFDLYDNHPYLTLPSTFNKQRKFIMDSNFYDHVNINYIDHSNIKLYKVTLHPGDSIIIPPWWWHNAISDDFSLSITTKFIRSDTSYLYKYPSIGLYKFAADTLFVQRFDKPVSYIMDYIPYYQEAAGNKQLEPYFSIIEENISCFLAFSYFIIIMYFYSIIIKYSIFYKFKLSIAIPFIMSILIIFEIFGLHLDEAFGLIWAVTIDIFDYLINSPIKPT
tara:strand:- start:467 stop:1750 length:1284 start_codon:yes stop_codon:yes gene_type:complete